MHIGLLIYGDINTLSGGYLYDRKLVDYLRSQGDIVEIISLPVKSYSGSLLSTEIPEAIRISNEGKNNKFDVLVQDELVHPSCLGINKKIKNLLGCPIVSLVHLLKCSVPAPLFKKTLIAYFEKKYLQSVDGLILNSRSTKEAAEKLLGEKFPAHIVAVPCADHFPENGAQDAKQKYADSGIFRILFVGNISRQKGLHVLIDAIAKLNDAKVSLTVVGDGNRDPGYMAELRKKLNSYRYHKQVIFKGRQSGEALQALYLEHDVFIMPSVNEAYGIAFLEALQFGLPVIATSQGGSKEFVRHGENGYLIEPGDSKQLAELISSLKSNAQQLQLLSDKAIASFKQHPRWQDSCRKIRDFLQIMVEKNQISTEKPMDRAL